MSKLAGLAGTARLALGGEEGDALMDAVALRTQLQADPVDLKPTGGRVDVF